MKKVGLSLVSCMLLVAFSGCGGNGGNDGGGDDDDATSSSEYNHKINRTNDSEISDNIFTKIRKSTVKINVSKSNNGYSWGSGFFINDEGYIVTNNHVVAGFNSLRIGINGEDRLVYAELAGYDECADIAVIKLTSNTKAPSYNQNLAYLTWQNNRVNFGDSISVAGFPGDSLDNKNEPMLTYNEGTVNTDTYQGDTRWASTEVFTHSAYTAGGNSGGAVMNTDTGEVVGIHYSGHTEIENRKYAISGVEAQGIVNKIIAEGNVLSIGITPRVYQHSDGTYLGVLVKEINAGEHAYNIGIRQHDIITELKGGDLQYDLDPRRVKTLDKYCGILRSNNPQKNTIPITVQRYTVNKRWVTCVGSINGDSLTLKDDKLTQCPNSETLNFNNKGLIVNTPSSILDPYTTTPDGSDGPGPDGGGGGADREEMSKKKYIIISRDYSSGLCESDYWKKNLIERGFVKPIFIEENDGNDYVTCETYSKKDDNQECSVSYNSDSDHTNFSCTLGYDSYQKKNKSSRSISEDFDNLNFAKTIINNISISE